MWLNKIAALLGIFPAMVCAEDAAALLAKARTAFINNQDHQRYWIWTTITTRAILDKSGKTVEMLPSVTIESPIRQDGKRCDAILAWGDGVEPYLKDASPEERCQVTQEVPPVLRLEAVLESEHAKVQSNGAAEIVLAIHAGKHPAETGEAATRCAGSVEGTIALDPATSFPKRVDLVVMSDGCQLKPAEYEEHYGGPDVKATGGWRKGTHVEYEYELQKDKAGDPSRDFWISTHRRATQPLAKNSTGMMISGRLFKLTSKGERQGVVDTVTKASEATAESTLKFEIPK